MSERELRIFELAAELSRHLALLNCARGCDADNVSLPVNRLEGLLNRIVVEFPELLEAQQNLTATRFAVLAKQAANASAVETSREK